MDTYDRLLAAARLSSDDAVIAVDSRWEPAGGPGARIYPPTFPVDAADPDRRSPYLIEDRRVGEEVAQTVVLDQTPSQANRLEDEVKGAVLDGRITLPYLVLSHELSGRTTRLTSLESPHRYADAYWRDSLVDGKPFDKSALGQRFRSASADDCTVLFEREPFSVLLGAWDSHRKGRAAKFPRVYRSEMFGVEPSFGRRAAGRMDPHNLVGAVIAPEHATDGSVGWEHTVPTRPAPRAERLSAIGHGNIAPVTSHGGVTVRDIRRVASLSMAGLARLRFGTAPADAADAARATLAALGLLADRLAFGGPGLWLRSGCDLVQVSERLYWQQRGGRTEEFELDTRSAIELFEHARQRAADAGLPMSDEVVQVTAGTALAKAINHAYLNADTDEDAP